MTVVGKLTPGAAASTPPIRSADQVFALIELIRDSEGYEKKLLELGEKIEEADRATEEAIRQEALANERLEAAAAAEKKAKDREDAVSGRENKVAEDLNTVILRQRKFEELVESTEAGIQERLTRVRNREAKHEKTVASHEAMVAKVNQGNAKTREALAAREADADALMEMAQAIKLKYETESANLLKILSSEES